MTTMAPGLFHYPMPVGALSTLAFVKYDHIAFLTSRLRRGAPEIVGAEHILQMQSIQESPPGTLTDDDEVLAEIVNVTLDVWRGLRARGALSGWKRCACADDDAPGGFVERLYHPRVLSALYDGVQGAAEKKSGAVRARLSRLRRQMEGMGYPPHVLLGQGFLEHVDKVLLERLGAGARRSVEAVHAAADRAIEARGDPPLIS